MFSTYVMACALIVGQDTRCTEFEDSYGPYYTEGECVARAVEMREDLIIHLAEPLGIPHIFQYKCVESEKSI
jgi:hypothetical protein